jgi:hypothetical protein
METFVETVAFVGAPLFPAVGNADTVMERLEDATPGTPIKTRLVAFANVSGAPIRLLGSGKLAGFYDVYVTLSPTAESQGTTTYAQTHEKGGTFQSQVTFSPMFELRPLNGGDPIIVDTGLVPIPGFPMKLGSVEGKWSLSPPTPHAARAFRAKPFFYEGLVVITAKLADSPFKDVALINGFGPGIIAACCKTQAEFTSDAYEGTLARRSFQVIRPFSNMELE